MGDMGEATAEEFIAGATGEAMVEATAEAVATLGVMAGESVFSGPWRVTSSGGRHTQGRCWQGGDKEHALQAWLAPLTG